MNLSSAQIEPLEPWQGKALRLALAHQLVARAIDRIAAGAEFAFDETQSLGPFDSVEIARLDGDVGGAIPVHRRGLCWGHPCYDLAVIEKTPPAVGHDDEVPVTALLQEWRSGSQEALDELIPALYAELLRIARAHMRGERSSHTLEPSALVAEAYARLIHVELDWQDRVHFLSVASSTMRRVLVDHARSKKRKKRAGEAIRVTLSESIAVSQDEDILRLEDSLVALEQRYPRKREILEMHFFGGLKYDEIARASGLSPATVARELRFAKAFLARELNAGSAAAELSAGS